MKVDKLWWIYMGSAAGLRSFFLSLQASTNATMLFKQVNCYFRRPLPDSSLRYRENGFNLLIDWCFKRIHHAMWENHARKIFGASYTCLHDCCADKPPFWFVIFHIKCVFRYRNKLVCCYSTGKKIKCHTYLKMVQKHAVLLLLNNGTFKNRKTKVKECLNVKCNN